MPVFIVAVGFIIYDKQLADPVIIAAVGFIVLIIFLLMIYLHVRKLVKKQYEAYRRLQLMAITDNLTQLYKRDHFDSLFENELARARRYDRSLCCAVIEIDDYDKIREKYGREFSDEVLQETAENIKDDLRVIDILARDENRFICLLPETDIKPALFVSKRLRSLIEGETFDNGKDDKTINITISIGITSSNPCQNKEIDINKIITIADNALDIAKRKGGNRIEQLSSNCAQAA